MNILITGGLGFLGSNLARFFVKKNHNVAILDGGTRLGGNYFNIHDIRDQVDVIKGDTSDYDLVFKNVKNKDHIYCCAGQVSSIKSLEDPVSDLHTNVYGNLNILRACQAGNKDATIIFTSSRAVYGTPQYVPMDENHPTNPFDGYGITKLAAEKYFLLYHKHHNLKTCILRLSNLFGPGQQLKTGSYQIIAWIYRRIVRKEPLIIYGNGKQARDFIFVDDVCRAMISAAKNINKTSGQIYNVGSGTSTSLNFLISKIASITSTIPKVKYHAYPKARLLTEVKSTTLDCNKIKKELGWKPTIKLEEGLGIMHKFYSDGKIMRNYI